jgi:tetratricopeptide (TPR) repeat protein
MKRTVRLVTWVLTLGLVACQTAPTPHMIREASLHRDLADIKLKKGELGFAIREYRTALELVPEDPYLHFGLGEAYRRKGMYNEAEQEFLRALEIDPDQGEARLNLAVVYLQQERWPEAIEANTAMVERPVFIRPSRALVNRGWAHYKSGDLEAAERDFREALKGSGAAHHAHLNLGIVLSEKGEVLEAITHFNRVLELIQERPNSLYVGLEAQARYRLAQGHVGLGQREKALQHFRAAADVGGDSEWGRKSREYLVVLE